MLVRFIAPPGVFAAGEGFQVGEQYDLDPGQAELWIRRGVAVAVEADEPAPAAGGGLGVLHVRDDLVEIVRAPKAKP